MSYLGLVPQDFSHPLSLNVRVVVNSSSKMISGHELAGAMWALTALSLVLVTLRLYTRIRIVKFVGVEDYLYACTGVSLGLCDRERGYRLG